MSAAWSTSSLISATLVTLATRWANLHVLIDSSVCARPGCIVATMTVLQFPPSESRSTCDMWACSLGTWGRSLCAWGCE